MDRKCAICGKTNGLFTIELPLDDEPDKYFTKLVCGNCWDIIAEIARRVCVMELEDKNRINDD